MDSLKIQGIFPSSISQISYANQQSQFGGQSIAHHKHQQKLFDYHIKIKGPENTHMFKNQFQQKPTYCQFQPSSLSSNIQPNNQNAPSSSQNIAIAHPPQQYNSSTTGYPLHRESFSQQEILKAFNIIDINKDNMITQEDLTFILDYMNQEYTQEEVKEMISMISVDGMHVGFDQFKKLGRGEIVPLAKFKIGGKLNKEKQAILKNIEEEGIFQQQPSFLIQNLKKDTISYDKFEQLKKGTKVFSRPKTHSISTDNLYSIIPILNQTQQKLRKNQFHSTVTTTIQNIIQNYNENIQKFLDYQKVANLLQINVKQAKQLYPNTNQINSLLAVMEGIAYSNQNIYKKLQMSLQVINNKDSICIDQLIHLLQILKGKDESLTKKIQAIWKSKGIDIQTSIKKNLAYQIVLQFSSKLIGFD